MVSDGVDKHKVMTAKKCFLTKKVKTQEVALKYWTIAETQLYQHIMLDILILKLSVALYFTVR